VTVVVPSRLVDHGDGIFSSPGVGEVSWLCDADQHTRCSGIVANWTHIASGVVLRPCGCQACAHQPDLASAAVALVARRGRSGGR